jgi:fumarylacetoacetate (FAA) hydrolase
MKLATLRSKGPDGRLVVVSRDGLRWLPADPVARTLQEALDNWNSVFGPLQQLSEGLEAGQGDALDASLLVAPLPRAWQWLDGSAFPTHGALMQKAFKLPPIETAAPLMYQGMSHQFLGPHDDVPVPSEADGIDFEGEFGVITDAVPMGVSVKGAADHINLIVQINDWSLRVIGPVEMKTGFGWVRAKPACSVAPFAVTPDELGSAWRNSRVCLELRIDWNGQRFGAANGSAMEFGFDELVAHAAYSRSLPAGTIIGSGTVSNENCREVGSSCIAERQGIEIIDLGAPKTGFMRFGDRVRMEAEPVAGCNPFGAIEQRVVAAAGHG